jgi:sugar lactone lactonase YvrE
MKFSRSPRGALRRSLGIALVATALSSAGAPPAARAVTPVVLEAEADARVVKSTPTTNFGTTTALEADTSPVVESFVRFTVSGVTDPVAQARLRLYVTDPSSNGPEIYPSDTGWSETTITWNTKPSRTGALLADVAGVAKGTWVEWNVTGLVTGDGTYSFDVAADSSDGTDLNSREAPANRPQLILDLTVPPGPDVTPPDTGVTSGPSGVTPDSSATFTFSATEAGSTFECDLDGAGFATCASPAAYSGLVDGPHTFAVRATDPVGNTDATPATRTWTIDSTVPPPPPPPPPPPALSVINTLAGTGSSGFSGDGGSAVAARLNAPRTQAADAAGTVYVVDTYNHRARRIDPSGVITTLAGTGTAGYSGDGGPATQARLDTPHGIAVDGAGNVYIADPPNHRIRRVDPSGIITTFAGTGTSGYNGDGIPAASARLNYPKGVEVGPDGSVYIGDANNHRVRRVSPSGTITTVAGTGSAGFSGDGASATSARLNTPRNVTFDSAGNLYIADDENCRVRRVDNAGVISTVAGSTTCGYGGDGGPATAARLGRVRDVAVDAAGNLYIADEENNRIRRVDPSGIMSTFAGTGSSGFSGDGGPPAAARISGPRGVAVDASGRVLIGDTGNHRVRRVS